MPGLSLVRSAWADEEQNRRKLTASEVNFTGNFMAPPKKDWRIICRRGEIVW
jgi:hypothetical protein